MPENDLSGKDTELLYLLVEAHQTAARDNNNASKVCFGLALGGSNSFKQAVVAGIMSTGQRHAPIREARAVFEHATLDWIEAQVKSGAMVPGFGNVFFKAGIDPAFSDVHLHLSENYANKQPGS